MGRWMKVVALAWLASLAGCDGSEPVTDGGADAAAPPSGAVARFEPSPAGPHALFPMPFPSDAYLGAGGTVELGEIAGARPITDNLRFELERRRGFCRTCPILFPIEGELDRASVPTDAGPNDRASIEDALVLLRADGVGEPIPLWVDWHAAQGQLVAMPRYGVVLEPATRYVAALTDALRAVDGSPLAPGPIFAALRDGEAVGPEGERVREPVEAALGALEAAGLERARVVAATAFTTDRGDGLLRAIRDVADAASPPSVTVERIWRAADGDLEALLGVPSENRPGIDVPPADGVGEAAIVHDAMAYVVRGTYQTPRIVSGEGVDPGLLRWEDDGSLLTGPTPETVPFVLIVPDVAELANLPLVIVHHGLPAHKRLGLRIGNTFARLGMAVLAYDSFLMGGRAASARDEMNEFRGTEEPDGFEEQDGVDVIANFMGLAGVDAERRNRLDHGLGAAAQWVLDLALTVRLVREGDVSALGDAEAALAGLSFDPGGVYYIGQSNGGIVGMGALPLLDEVQASVLMVGPPDFQEVLCNGPDNRTMVEPVLLPLLGLRGPLETAGRRLCFTGPVILGRWVAEPLSPAQTLHFALVEPLRDDRTPPDILFLYGVFDELIGSTGEHVLGVAGVPVRGRTFFVDPPRFTAPLSANFEVGSEAITAGAFIYEADHNFVRTKHVDLEYEPPIMAPFDRTEARPHENPIEQVHAEIQHFFRTRMETGRAEIADMVLRATLHEGAGAISAQRA